MNAPERFVLPDIQSSIDLRRLPIQQVGIKGLRLPLALRQQDGSVLSTVATLTMTVGLPADVKGTHMSRFIELMAAKAEPLAIGDLPALLDDMLQRLGADSGRIEMRFAHFVRKQAPVSGVESLLDLDAGIDVARDSGGKTIVSLQVVVPVTSLCPCSKQISRYGAHNQRSHITVRVDSRGGVTLDELVRIAEIEASCEVFGLLKRPDEKWVTERAYDNPKFVEDLVRDIALRLRTDQRIGRWSVASENFESIHNHSAYALIAGCNA